MCIFSEKGKKQTRSQRTPVPETYAQELSRVQADASYLERGPQKLARDSSSLPSLTPSPLPSPQPSPSPLPSPQPQLSPFPLPQPSPSLLFPSTTPEEPLDSVHSDAGIRLTDTMLMPSQTMNPSSEQPSTEASANGSGLDPSPHDNRSIYHALQCSAFRLMHYTQIGNAYLEVCLDYGRRKRITLLSMI